jgi:hypothetical protein
MGVLSTDNIYYKQQFSDTVMQLAGSPDRSMLKGAISFKRCRGEAASIDTIDTGLSFTNWEDADNAWSALKDKSTHPDYIAARTAYLAAAAALTGSEDVTDLTPLTATFENVKTATETPHNEVAKARTIVVPDLVEWGHYFDEDEELLEMADPTSMTTRQGMKAIWWREDAKVLGALRAATVTRARRYASEGGTAIDFATVGHPNGVIAPGASTAVTMTKDLFAQVKEKFEANYCGNERIFGVISPAMKTALIAASGSTIHSSDFVTARQLFETGDLPDIYGVSLMVHPLVKANEPVFFTEAACVWAEFKPLEVSVGIDPAHRFQKVVYIREKAGCVRVDDKRVVWVTLGAATG